MCAFSWSKHVRLQSPLLKVQHEKILLFLRLCLPCIWLLNMLILDILESSSTNVRLFNFQRAVYFTNSLLRSWSIQEGDLLARLRYLNNIVDNNAAFWCPSCKSTSPLDIFDRTIGTIGEWDLSIPIQKAAPFIQGNPIVIPDHKTFSASGSRKNGIQGHWINRLSWKHNHHKIIRAIG